MKTKLLTFLFAFTIMLQFASAQNIFLPDTNWRNFLISQGLGSCIVGDSMNTTCPDLGTVTTILLPLTYVNDITGVEYLTNVHYLDVGSNGIDSIAAFPPNLDTLIIGDNFLNSIPALPSTLIDLEIDGNFLTTFPALPPLLQKLVLGVNQLTSLPTFPSTLIELEVRNGYITTLPALPSGMQSIYIESCQLTSIPALPGSLVSLTLKSNQLTSIASFPLSLLSIDVSYNQITSLPALPTVLTSLNCSSNHLTTLPALPSTLLTLSAGQNQISSVPALSSGLQSLNLIQNPLSTVPTIPQSLRSIDISSCQFTSLPILPDSLTMLRFGNNMITQIDSFPKMVQLIAGWSNQLVSTPAIPIHCVDFLMSYNSLVHIPAFPNSIGLLDVSHNAVQDIVSLPDSSIILQLNDNPLSCLPPFIYSENVMIENTNIHCLPSLGMNAYFDIDISSFPLCQPSSGCEINWNISGKVFNDTNLNCVADTGEQVLRHIRVELISSGILQQICYTNLFGEYSFRAPAGNYNVTIDVSALPFYINCPSVNMYNVILTPIDSMVDSLDFSLTCHSNFDLTAISIVPYRGFVPGQQVELYLYIGEAAANYGTSCYNGTATVYAVLPPLLHYVSPATGAIAPTSVVGDSLVWSISDISQIDLTTAFNIIVSTDTSAVLGDSVCIMLGILPPGDEIPSNNMLTECFEIRSSFDPNEKWISPSEADTTTHAFTFTVNFQNTGNAPAENIYILDTLDNDLDASTFEMIASDHDVVTQLLPGNILRFNFHAINLPDSTSDEVHSHGFVKYRINRKALTGIGTEISNTAYIFFDYNQPVVTNTVSTTISATIGIGELNSNSNNVTLFPNPTSIELNLYSEKEVIHEVYIYNLLGKEVFVQKNLKNLRAMINVGSYPKGAYCVRIKTQSGISQKLFIKQ